MTILADTSQVVLRYMPEDTWGEIPTTALKELRLTGESLKVDRQTTQSEEIRDDRQITDIIATKVEASGGINGEFSYGAYDDLLEAALYTEAVTTSYTSSSVSIASNIVTLPGGHGQTFFAGQKIKMAGWSTTANNGYFTVTAVATNTLTLAETMTDDIGGEAVTISSKVMRNGVTRTSFVLEKSFGDVEKFIAFTGMVVASCSIGIEAQNKITTSFNFLGKNGQTGDATVGTGSPTAATTNAIMNAGDHVGAVKEGGTDIAIIKSLSIDINNNLRGKAVIGVIGNGEIGSGRIAVTGNISLYFADFAIYDKFIENETSSIRMTLKDTNGEYDIYFPKIKFTKADIVAGGPDQDVMVDGSYQALRDPVTGVTVMITKV